MNTCLPQTLWDAFSSVPDHRDQRGRRFPLPALLTLATAAMLCGRVTLTGIAWWTRTLTRGDLAELGIRARRGPCPATWCIFFQSLRVDDLETALGSWVRGQARSLGHVAIDGKWLCGAHGRGEEPVKLLAAFSTELHGVVASVKVPAGTNEIGIVSELLRRLPLEGATITGDAAFTRASVARQIVEGGGDYFLTVKGNHRHLRRDLAALFHETSPWRRQPGQALSGRTAATVDTAGRKSATSRPCPCRSVICTGLARPRLVSRRRCAKPPCLAAHRPSAPCKRPRASVQAVLNRPVRSGQVQQIIGAAAPLSRNAGERIDGLEAVAFRRPPQARDPTACWRRSWASTSTGS
jgi:hypothetical protein